jgi:murein L,D-transpeptidase YcbB/YkuD
MSHTRRILTQTLLLSPAVAAIGGMLRPKEAAAQAVSAAVPDFRAHILRAQNAMPTTQARARQAAERTLARLDELEIDFAAPRLILVNIPAAEVIAFADGREVMRSRAVVGTGRTRTPQLLTFATSVRTNPPWHVPASIMAEIRASGAAGFQAVGGRLIQPPGPNNPLGPLRIGLLDSDGIFLHGTNRTGLFGREGRSLSHGCVRVERIRDLSAWMLDVPPAEVQAAAATGRTMELHPTQEVQVALAYLTAWPDSAGRMAIHPDPYGLDAPGARPARFRRVYRETQDDPLEVEAAARATMAAAGRF